jgi:glycosyltransferase involved in cell wall biosynthesis
VTGIHQILAAASPGDAITNSSIELRDLLRRAVPSEIYARHIAPELRDDILSLEDYSSRHTSDILVYHASIGEPLVHAFLLGRREPLVLVYHNVTPARYFHRWDPTFAELLDLGRAEMVDLRHRVVTAIADSTFNAVELETVGYGDVRVIPPVVDPYRLTRVEPRATTLNHLEKNLGGEYLLYVGQLLPHKRPDFLVRAMHMAGTYLGVRPFLLLIGHARLPGYTSAIIEQIRELNLANVHLVGPVPTEDLAAFYTRAAGVVTASEHEGFCVPLVEAMAFGKPIVARGCGAVPETLGNGGLCLAPDDGPAVFAEAVYEVMQDLPMRRELAARATERAAYFDPERAQAELFNVLLEVV